MVISHRWRKWFSSSAGPLFQSVTQRRFLRWEHCVSTSRTKFRGCHPGLLSINFDFPNVIFHPMLFPFVWAKYKWKFMRHCCKLSFPQPLMVCRSLVPSRTARFAHPDRRACSQAMYKWVFSPSIQWQWQIRNWTKIRDYFLTTKIINYSPTDMNPRLPLYDQQQSDFNTLSDISSLLFWKIGEK